MLPSMQQPLKLMLRKSMRKFDSQHRNLEVIRVATNQAAFLNRQIITLLSVLGVPDGTFVRLQKEMISELDSMFHSNEVNNICNCETGTNCNLKRTGLKARCRG